LSWSVTGDGDCGVEDLLTAGATPPGAGIQVAPHVRRVTLAAGHGGFDVDANSIPGMIMTIRSRSVVVTFALAIAVTVSAWLATSGSASAAEVVRHLSLVRSSPAADANLQSSPREIRLVFSEAPQLASSSIRLTRGTETLVPSTDTAADSADAKQLVIHPTQALANGSYTVHWRVMAKDGHSIRGTYGFQVSASTD
jgi:methionine-rich copper-binding protein CopC